MARQRLEAYIRVPSAFHRIRQCQHSAQIRLSIANSIGKWVAMLVNGSPCTLFVEIDWVGAHRQRCSLLH